MSGGASATTVAAVAGASLAAVGTGVSVMGQMQQASAAKAAANYQSEVAAGNQQIATQNADYAGASGEQTAAASEMKTRTQIGQIEAGEASSGVDINSPTSSALRSSQDLTGQLDAQTIRSNAARQAYGYETQATGFENTASAETATGENAQTAGEVGAGGSLLSGVGNEGLNYAGVMNKASGLDTGNSINEGSASNASLNQTPTGYVGGGGP